LLLLASCLPASAADPKPTPAHEINARLGRGINFGNALEAPSEGAWGFRIEEPYFDEIKNAGFDTIRLPVKWSIRAGATAPYKIDPKFFERVDWCVENALKRDLNVVLNMHHYDEFYDDPNHHEERFLAMWRQIAPRYAEKSDSLVFELLNEPRPPMTPERWNAVVPKALAVVRESNPTRAVMIGPGNWNNLEYLPKLELPQDDNLIVTFHYYSPFHFTHQGAEWSEGADKWLGTKWGSAEDRAAVRKDLDTAAAWAKEHNKPLFLGEFGAYSKADMDSRVKWTTFIRSEAEKRKMSWAYWEFGSGFGAYDPATNKWRDPLKNALVGK
jgi:endoglucanase